ncbi:MAG: M28 family peptidase [Candidatus Bathyarchaeia archaeon]
MENIAFGHYAFRSGGSLGADEAAYWIKSRFESFGLDAWLESFEFTTWNPLDKPTLIIDVDGNMDTTNDQILIDSFQSTHLSWPTQSGGVFADLVILPLPKAENIYEIGVRPINETEWNAINTTGKVVLIGMEVRWSGSWEQTFIEKITEQTPAAIVYTWWYDWMSFTPIMFSSAGGRPLSGFGPYYWNNQIPVGAVNYGDGMEIRNLEDTVNVSAHVLLNSVIDFGQHYNVVGKIEGYENPNKFVIISAHYDTVMCAGFCDNGAGTAGIIELARVFAEAVVEGIYKPKYTLLFVAFASEELGLVGSINYLMRHKNEMPNIVAVINLDCIGSDELRVTETEAIDGFDLDEAIVNAAHDLGIPIAFESPGGSDQETFRNPSWADWFYYWCWQLEANISDVTAVKPSALIVSYPLFYRDLWNMGSPGWIHTSYDNSTSTSTLNWVEVDDLENHLKVAALSLLRISPTTHFYILMEGPYFTWYGVEYWIVDARRHPIRIISNYK